MKQTISQLMLPYRTVDENGHRLNTGARKAKTYRCARRAAAKVAYRRQ